MRLLFFVCCLGLRAVVLDVPTVEAGTSVWQCWIAQQFIMFAKQIPTTIYINMKVSTKACMMNIQR